MSRKRLADLLREEVNQGEISTSPAPTEQPPLEEAPIQEQPLTSSEPAPEIQALTAENQALQRRLEQERERSAALEQALNQAKQDLAAQFTQTQTLSQSLTERDQTLSAALAANQTLQAELAELRPLAEQLTQAQEEISQLQSQSSPLVYVPPRRYVAPSQPSLHLSNEEIGWFD
ncbi:MAG: hypothetical protein GC158_00920 [Cyanobacteria bacterium RI_101]|nr:hypothetical protein [Cyanobacteria bacterium RI_101]